MLYERDWLMRQIRQIMLVLAELLRLRQQNEVVAAFAALREAYGRLHPSLGGFLQQLDAPSAAALLGDPVRVLALSRLRWEEAGLHRQQGDEAGAGVCEAQARELLALALADAPELATVPEARELLWDTAGSGDLPADPRVSSGSPPDVRPS